MVKNPSANAGDSRDSGSSQDWEDPPTPIFLPGEFHGQGSLMGYSSWGREESDITERMHARAHTHTHTHTQTIPNLVLNFLLHTPCKNNLTRVAE